MPDCFTCKNKKERSLSSEEISKKRIEQFKKTGVMLPISFLEFKCDITGKIISQNDPACDDYKDLF
jgi:hypothetical protein